jgi:tellurite resistance-related uncharacterized protein
VKKVSEGKPAADFTSKCWSMVRRLFFWLVCCMGAIGIFKRKAVIKTQTEYQQRKKAAERSRSIHFVQNANLAILPPQSWVSMQDISPCSNQPIIKIKLSTGKGVHGKRVKQNHLFSR